MEVSMREILFPRLIRLRADDELAHNLAEVTLLARRLFSLDCRRERSP
jgi:hypothetical protein